MKKNALFNLEHAALLVVDMQNDFALPGAIMEVYGTYNIISPVKKVLSMFRQHKRPIFHMVKLNKPDGSDAENYGKELLEKGEEVVLPNSDGAEIVEDLKPGVFTLHPSQLLEGKMQTLTPYEFVLYKPQGNAFYQTHLEDFLKKMHINTLIVAGCNYPNCPKTTLIEAVKKGFHIVLLEDCTSGLYEEGISEIERIGGSVFSVEKLERTMQSK